MSKTAKKMYVVPEWMRPLLPLFHNTGGNDVEELLHDEDTNMFANSVRYTFIVSARSQFALLMDMYSKGIITGRTSAAKCSDTLTDGQLLFRLQDFYGAGQDAMEINDHEYAQECTDVVSIIREVIESRKALEAAEKRAVEMPTFDGYVPHVARELQAAFRIACDNAGINITAAGKGE
ncbi:hypothetical protein [Enterobacter hormaechei]|uniref:hypothetical protein n=1 Tax=Enterobacter hormaechei TaxID=158836 RepID=UPI00254EB022|nr:hypothetical protein [Enterobacter hormaechei]MEC5805319.1 hypothetical protein [Enterobacter hormaechei]